MVLATGQEFEFFLEPQVATRWDDADSHGVRTVLQFLTVTEVIGPDLSGRADCYFRVRSNRTSAQSTLEAA